MQHNDYYELMRFVPAVKADGMGTWLLSSYYYPSMIIQKKKNGKWRVNEADEKHA